jgi:translation elongation factor P/translation initiation factor 5A
MVENTLVGIKLFKEYSLIRLNGNRVNYAIIDKDGKMLVFMDEGWAKQVANQEGKQEEAREAFGWV